MVSLPSFEHFVASFQFMVDKSMDDRKLSLFFFFFYNNMEKVQAELALFFVEKVRTLQLTSLLLSVLN